MDKLDKSPFFMGKWSFFMGKWQFFMGKSPFFMGKLPFSLAFCIHLPGGRRAGSLLRCAAPLRCGAAEGRLERVGGRRTGRTEDGSMIFKDLVDGNGF